MKNLKVIKFKDSKYRNKINIADEDLIYCELSYERDRSSYAGVAFKVNNHKNDIVVRECSEIMIKEENKYDKIYIGCDEDYVKSIKEILLLEKRTFGIEIYFLVYSDIRSSKLIFEKLMKEITNNTDIIVGIATD